MILKKEEEMKFSVATNWDDNLIREIENLNSEHKVTEIFGKLASDFVGGGRVSLALPHPSKRQVRRHIQEAHKHGLKFNYLLNASCLDNQEFTISGQREIHKLLDWLGDLKVDVVTVSIPYLLQLIKRQYPQFKVCISIMSQVNTPQRAKYWQDLGADIITLYSIDVTRDFPILRAIRKRVNCELQLIANNGCLLNCPFTQYHGVIVSHASQSTHKKQGFEFYYCMLNCRLFRLTDPVNFLRSDWIRPEDTRYYEEVGINRIKLTERVSTTELISQVVKAYTEGRYDGNLADIIPSLSQRTLVRKKKRTVLINSLRYLFHPFSVNIFRLFKSLRAFSTIDVYIDNRALDGFLEHFFNENCNGKSCEECGYCKEIAKKAIKIDEDYRKRIIAQYKNLLDELVSSKMFKYI